MSLKCQMERKGRTRGAAMVEAVVAIPVFVLMFGALVFVGQLYGSKQKVVRDSTQAAWSNAMHSCESGGWTKESDSAINEFSAHDSTGGISQGSSSLAEHADDSAKSVYGREFGSAVSTIDGAVTAGSILGSRSTKLTTTTRVMCNEVTKGGAPQDAAMYAFKNLTRW